MIITIGIAIMAIGFGVYFSETETTPPKQLEGHYHQIQVNDNVAIGEKHG
ncbi:hypothetical protein [Candidatus Nitrosotalea okcheonensis]|uniref:Uncharacterized protein n=1 Tax=Candidatus Nitrosotalea okcheonensis TaxID=1903276 RepID=A0A2H1FI33_9ARCH|nr:hypothetical protein [Candidatus Nitrosotalea okcheonensis]MDE1727782.1 hypothetical protein [Nitrososphaerota archaeon]MDE1832338.1 hypothetical protein [Nitrososphaerota archaeon]MDE1840616.1 hypothetical protein [Nitrososphaerota archaeon]MDE1877556.1 hypothetical protein [Nitrososphaerota archaeon]SMH72426.1 protein of unknown function [Candidatus Nitrosotalea okcheonensis]